MASIVAFGTLSKEVGEDALERLEGVAQHVALVYKGNGGKVKVQQSSDLTVGTGTLHGALLGAAVSVFTGPLVGLAAADSAAGAAYGALQAAGVNDTMMTLAGRQLEAGRAAVFVLADDAVAHAIESAVREAGVHDIEVASFPPAAAIVVRGALGVR